MGQASRRQPSDESDDPAVGSALPDDIDVPLVVARSPSDGVDAPKPVGGRNWREASAGSLVSAALHATILLTLGLWILPEIVTPEPLAVVLSHETAAPPELMEFLATTEALPTDAAGAVGSPGSVAVGAQLAGTGRLTVATDRIDARHALALPNRMEVTPRIGSPHDLGAVIQPLRRSDPRAGGIVTTTAVGSAVEGILGHVRGELDSDMVQVVWLLDASLSLEADRQEIAARVAPFYREMQQRPGKKERPLRSVVMSYAKDSQILLRSTENVVNVVETIRRMPSDPTGLENVFNAIQHAVRTVSSWKGTTVLVVWTDESGDDHPLLEETIQACRRERVVVHVVGPEAVLGMEQGLQRWVIPETQQAFLLPVKRGPDACWPERLRLPYWFDDASPPWSQGGAYIPGAGATYGGPYREGVLSGVGPYALTRLALETGGTFSILRRRGEAGPAWTQQQRYLPDYEAPREILSALRTEPLRQAVVDATALTWQADLRPPLRVFFLQQNNVYPYRPYLSYQPPPLFQAALKAALPDHLAQAERDLAVIETALSRLDPIKLGSAYENERLPRWRAWYDLNLGRLLAMSVRLAEYRETLRLVREGVGVTPQTNHLELLPTRGLKSGRVADQRATWAHEHLTRVTREHAGTPWAQLAQWELDHALGFIVQPKELPLPKPVAGPAPKPAAPGGVPTLPSL